MCIAASTPKPPPPEAPKRLPDGGTADGARRRERDRRKRAAGISRTLLTGAGGLVQDAPTTGKTLLGA